MAITKPVKNQMAFWEKIEDHGNVNGNVVIDISKSTTHKLTLTGDINISFSDIAFIPDDSIVTFSILSYILKTSYKKSEPIA